MNLDEYLSLIPPSHRISREEGQEYTRFARFVRMVLEQGVATGNLLEAFPELFSIDQAVGKQLDTLGVILGVSRQLPFVVSDSISSLLGDEDYRVLLRGAVAKQAYRGTTESLREVLSLAYPGEEIIFQDNYDMTVTVRASFEGALLQAMYNDMLLPRPAGVNYFFQQSAPNYCTPRVLTGVSDVWCRDYVVWQ